MPQWIDTIDLEHPGLDPRVVDLVQALHDAPHRMVIAAAGAGAGLQYLLWEVAGASRTLLNCHFPYAPAAMRRFLGAEPQKAVCEDTARRMAIAALNEARDLLQMDGHTDEHALGLGLTAAVETDRERRGEEECYIAVACADGTVWNSYILFNKGVDDRVIQSTYCELHALNLLGRATLGRGGVVDSLERSLAGMGWGASLGGQRLPNRELPRTDVKQLIDEPVLFMPDGQVHRGLDAVRKALTPDKNVLFPGSFNPLSYGHREMAGQLSQHTGKQVVFHITRSHPDKPPMPDEHLQKLLNQFAWYAPVLVTNGDRRYMDKAEMFPGITFAIGVDAMKGLLNPKYYEDAGGLEGCISRLIEHDAHFVVFGRVDRETGKYETLEDVPMPPALRARCISAITGRWDISSTELRARATK